MNDTQKHLIAGCLLDNEAMDDINLSVEDFTGPCRDIWGAMLDLRAQGEPVEPILVSRASGFSAHVLIEWFDLLATTSGITRYGKLVKDEADRRRIINLTQDALTAAKENGEPGEIISTLEKELFSITSDTEGAATFAKDSVNAVVNQMESAYKNGGMLTGLRTGFKYLDNMLCGLQKSDSILIACRPSVGKTAFGLNIAEEISINNQRCGLVISKEMSTDALLHRMISSRAGVDSMKTRRGTFREADFPAIAKASSDIKQSQLMIDDRDLNIQQIRAEARRCKRKFDIKYLMVDYVQLIQAQGYDDFRARVSFVSGQLKACAKELNIPVITLAQVTREAGKDGAMPRLEHLKESGSLEEDADVVILLHREKKHDNEEAIAIIAKQRNGPLGVVRLNFNGPLTRFTERD